MVTADSGRAGREREREREGGGGRQGTAGSTRAAKRARLGRQCQAGAAERTAPAAAATRAS